MRVICIKCHKIIDVPDPPEYEEIDIIDKLCMHSGTDHAICYDCVRELLEKKKG